MFPAAMSLFNSSSVHAHHKTAQSALTLLTSCTASNSQCILFMFSSVDINIYIPSIVLCYRYMYMYV